MISNKTLNKTIWYEQTLIITCSILEEIYEQTGKLVAHHSMHHSLLEVCMSSLPSTGYLNRSSAALTIDGYSEWAEDGWITDDKLHN